MSVNSSVLRNINFKQGRMPMRIKRKYVTQQVFLVWYNTLI